MAESRLKKKLKKRISSMTGAQVSDAEMARIASKMPKPGSVASKLKSATGAQVSDAERKRLKKRKK